MTCLASGVLLNAAMGPYKGKGGSEHTLLRSLLPSIQSGNILLGDALCGSYVTLAECLTRGIDVVFEQNGGRKRSTDFRRGTRLGSKDQLITLKKPVQRPAWMSKEQYQSLAQEIVIRELRVGDKTLITPLCDQPAPTYEESYLMELFRLVSAQRRGNRPGRIEPRAVKRRPKPFSLLTCPRREAQALIRKNGHPPKRREWDRTAQCDSQQSRAAGA